MTDFWPKAEIAVWPDWGTLAVMKTKSFFVRVGAVAYALSLSAMLSAATEASEDGKARYVHTDGGFALIIDRAKRMSTSDPFPTEGQRTADGHIVTDSMSYGYGDCSTSMLVCADFEEFMLAVPRQGGLLDWKQDGWMFKRTACLDASGGACGHYVVTFRNTKAGHEGGFIYSTERGVEMYFVANFSRKDQRQIYVLGTQHGLLHGGRP
jgi:hypothetical protein